MVDAEVDALAAILLFLDEASSQAPAPGIDNGAALFALDRGVEAQVFPASETEATEVFFVPKLVGAVLHQLLQLNEGLFNL